MALPQDVSPGYRNPQYPQAAGVGPIQYLPQPIATEPGLPKLPSMIPHPASPAHPLDSLTRIAQEFQQNPPNIPQPQQTLDYRVPMQAVNALAGNSANSDPYLFNQTLNAEMADREAMHRAVQQAAQQAQQQPYQLGHGQAADGGQVAQWVDRALAIMGMSRRFAPGIENIIQHESSGNPRSVNNWDSNAAAGHPSEGLMQTIQPTFDEWALPGHGQIMNPIDNIIAGVRYALDRYGKGMILAGGRHDSHGNYIGY